MEWSPQQAGSFYVYRHVRSDDGTPFYIGKGTGRRAHTKSRRNSHWGNIASKHGFKVEMLAQGLTEELAFLTEIEAIDKYERLGVALCNMTTGGEGQRPTGAALDRQIERNRAMWASGHFKERHRAAQIARWSSESARAAQKSTLIASYASIGLRDKISSAVRNAHKADATISQRIGAANRLRLSTPKEKTRLSAEMSARMADPATREKIRNEVRERSARPVVCESAKLNFPAIADAVVWLRSIGHSKAADAAVIHACSGRKKTAHGHKWLYTAVTRAAERVTVVV